jgi:hypothetical protein
MTKGQNKSAQRRRLRKRNRNSNAKRDIMLGRASRRGWGMGVVK